MFDTTPLEAMRKVYNDVAVLWSFENSTVDQSWLPHTERRMIGLIYHNFI